MADQTIDPELIQRLTDEVKKLGIGFSKLAESIGDGFKKTSTEQTRERQNLFRRLKDSFTSKGSAKFTKTVEQAIEGTAQSLDGLGQAADSASASLGNFAKSMASMNSTLAGSLLGLGDISAKTAEAMKGFAQKVENKGGGDAAKVRLSLRNAVMGDVDTLRSFGVSLGSAEALLSHYTTTLASGAKLGELSDSKIADAISDLARNANSVAVALGADSETILKIASEQQASAVYRSKLTQMSADEQLRFVTAMSAATAGLAAQGGEVGTMFAKMLAETVSTGNAAMTEAGKAFSAAGVQAIIPAMNDLAQKLENASPADAIRLQAEFIDKFQKEAQGSLEALEKNALAGNASAKQTLAILAKTKKISADALNKVRDEVKKATPTTDRPNRVPSELIRGMETPYLQKIREIQQDNAAARDEKKRPRQPDRERRSFDGRGAVESTSRILSGEHAEAISTTIAKVLGAGVIAKLADVMVDHFQKNMDAFRGALEVGAQFNQGIMGMARAAVDSGMSLSMFGDLIEKNSALAAAMGGGTRNGADELGKFTREVRTQSRAMGNFGYTIEGLNEVSAEYLNTVRLGRNLNDITSEERSKMIESVQDYAREVMAGSTLFGKNRKDIVRDSMDAQRNEIFMSRVMGDNAEALTKKFSKAINFFASVPTEFGKKLTIGLAETIGYGAGTAVFSEVGRMMADTGMGHLVPVMDGLAAKLNEVGVSTEAGLTHSVSAFRSIVGEIGQNEEALKLQALAGNTSAREMLRFYNETKNLNEDQLRARMKSGQDMASFTDKVSNGLLTIRDRFLEVTSKMRGKFLGFFEKLTTGLIEGLDKFGDEGWDRLYNAFVGIIQNVGTLIARTLNIKLEDATGGIGGSVASILEGLTGSAEAFSQHLKTFIGENQGGIFALLGDALKTLTEEFPKATKALMVLTAAVVTLTGIMGVIATKNAISTVAKVAGAVGGAGAAAAGVGAAGVAAGAAGAGAKSLGAKALGAVAAPVGVALTANEVLGMTDPNGNLWGLTDGIDNWFKKNVGFNPSNLSWRPGDDEKLNAPAPAPSPKPAEPTQRDDALERLQARIEALVNALPEKRGDLTGANSPDEMLKEMRRIREAIDGQTMFLGEQQRQGNRISTQQNRILSDRGLTRD